METLRCSCECSLARPARRRGCRSGAKMWRITSEEPATGVAEKLTGGWETDDLCGNWRLVGRNGRFAYEDRRLVRCDARSSRTAPARELDAYRRSGVDESAKRDRAAVRARPGSAGTVSDGRLRPSGDG